MVAATGRGRQAASVAGPRKHVGGVVYSPYKARRQLRAATHLRVGPGAGVYLAAVIDMLTQDALVLAIERQHRSSSRQAAKHCGACEQSHVSRINPHNLVHMLKSDPDYAVLTADVVIPRVSRIALKSAVGQPHAAAPGAAAAPVVAPAAAAAAALQEGNDLLWHQ